MGLIELAILNSTLNKIEKLYSNLGNGAPDSGGIIGDALKQFEQAFKNLGSAFPGGGWKGLGANKYANRNQDFMNLFKKLMDTMQQVQKLIGDQADGVNRARRVLESQMRLLRNYRGVAIFPGIGTGIVCATAMGRVNAALNALKQQSQRNAGLLRSLLDMIKSLLDMLSKLIPRIPIPGGGLPIPVPGGGTPGGGSQPSPPSGAPGSGDAQGAGNTQGANGSGGTSGLIGAAPLRSGSPRLELRPRDEEGASDMTNMLGGPPAWSAQGRPGAGMGMAPMAAGSGRGAAAASRTKKKEDTKRKKYFEGAEIGENGLERAPVEVGTAQARPETESEVVGAGTRAPLR